MIDPPRQEVAVPILRVPDQVWDGELSYVLASVPFSRFHLQSPLILSEHQGTEYLRWVKEAEVDRASYAWDFLHAAGAPIGVSPSGADISTGFGDWLIDWIPQATRRIGQWSRPSAAEPDFGSHSEAIWEQMLNSLAHDLAFILVSLARQTRPNYDWYLSRYEDPSVSSGQLGARPIYYVPAFNPFKPWTIPTLECLLFATRVLNGPTEGYKPRGRRPLVPTREIADGPSTSEVVQWRVRVRGAFIALRHDLVAVRANGYTEVP